jgi:hypothetical protein
MDLKEKLEVCSKALISWMMMEKQDNYNPGEHSNDIDEIFIAKMLFKKFKAFNIDIILPDMLLIILYTCTENNPGQTQIILKYLLEDIKDKKGPIKPGYAITSDDFASCFMTNFPIMEIPAVSVKYLEMWDAQKRKTTNIFESDNLCDTPEWWKEVME